jgi:hypothetical protein
VSRLRRFENVGIWFRPSATDHPREPVGALIERSKYSLVNAVSECLSDNAAI